MTKEEEGVFLEEKTAGKRAVATGSCAFFRSAFWYANGSPDTLKVPEREEPDGGGT